MACLSHPGPRSPMEEDPLLFSSWAWQVRGTRSYGVRSRPTGTFLGEGVACQSSGVPAPVPLLVLSTGCRWKGVLGLSSLSMEQRPSHFAHERGRQVTQQLTAGRICSMDSGKGVFLMEISHAGSLLGHGAAGVTRRTGTARGGGQPRAVCPAPLWHFPLLVFLSPD